jgi:uncharacterized protein
MDFKTQTGEDIFECQQCGQCCNGFGGTYLTGENITRISEFIHVDPETFIPKYCDQSGSRLVLTRGEDGFCIFFDSEKQCTTHPVKPYMCRAWPFIKTLLKNPENWDIMANSCPGMKKNIPLSVIKKIVAKEKKKLDSSI